MAQVSISWGCPISHITLVYSRKSNKNTVCGRFSIYEHYYGSNGHKSGLPAVDVGVAVEGKAEGCGGTGKGKCMGWAC